VKTISQQTKNILFLLVLGILPPQTNAFGMRSNLTLTSPGSLFGNIEHDTLKYVILEYTDLETLKNLTLTSKSWKQFIRPILDEKYGSFSRPTKIETYEIYVKSLTVKSLTQRKPAKYLEEWGIRLSERSENFLPKKHFRNRYIEITICPGHSDAYYDDEDPPPVLLRFKLDHQEQVTEFLGILHSTIHSVRKKAYRFKWASLSTVAGGTGTFAFFLAMTVIAVNTFSVSEPAKLLPEMAYYIALAVSDPTKILYKIAYETALVVAVGITPLIGGILCMRQTGWRPAEPKKVVQELSRKLQEKGIICRLPELVANQETEA